MSIDPKQSRRIGRDGATLAHSDPGGVSRALRILGRCNRALIDLDEEIAMLREVCRILRDEAGYCLAWVGCMEACAGSEIKPSAWAWKEEESQELEPRTLAQIIAHKGGPAMQALHSGETVCVQDHAIDLRNAYWRDSVLQRGCRASIALPLREDNGATFGLLAIYSSVPDVFTPEETELLEEVSGELAYGIVALRDRFRRRHMEQRRAEQDRAFHMRLLECMDRINRAIQGSSDLEQMLGDALDVVLEVLACDRASLVYPCDPDAPSWRVPMERTRPEYPGIFALGIEMPMTPEVANMHRASRASHRPFLFGPGTDFPLPESLIEYHEKSGIGMAIYPKTGDPWGFSVQQCAYQRDWTAEDVRIFEELGRRIADGVTGLLAYRQLWESETRLRTLVQTIPDLVWLKDTQGVFMSCNARFESLLGAPEAGIVGKTDYDFVSRELADFFREHDRKAMEAGEPCVNEEWLTFADGGYQGLFETIKTPLRDPTGKITGVLGVSRDITAHHEAEERIEHLAYHDLLTELPNRRLLHDRLHHALANCARSGHKGALLFIDLDNFKVLNDTSGHDVGDRLLIEVARRLATCVREGDTIARLGGDEFVVMLDGLSGHPQEAAAQAEKVGEKILTTLQRAYVINGREHHSTPSIGVTLLSDCDASVEEILKQADIAMYQAKAAGRNTLRFFNPEMQAVLASRAALEAALRCAIQDRQFTLHYQPQVDARGGILGAEVLLRWEHPERGLVPPGEFIPLAEETGQILSIGQWMLEKACHCLKSWTRSPLTRTLNLAVNVSARQFWQRDFVDQVRQALARTGAPAGRLKLELTESLVLKDVADAIEKMQALKQLGVGFSMDDFGTGYSSLSYLTRLSLDQLKIDKSFVCNLPDSASDAVVVQSIITLARSLGLNVIAEGVETEAQRRFLEWHGCTAFQGYLFSEPVVLPRFEALLDFR